MFSNAYLAKTIDRHIVLAACGCLVMSDTRADGRDRHKQQQD